MPEVRQSPARPFIGLVPSHDGETHRISQRYLDALWRAGGFPVLLSYTTDPLKIDAYADQLDGFLFSGGLDVNPHRYGEEKQSDAVEMDDERDAFEEKLFFAVYARKKPIFGVCRGIQSINVFLGGTLYQHMEGHSQKEPGEIRTHLCRVTEGSLLDQWLHLPTIRVNSFHHQAVKDVAPSLRVDAVSEDGYVEAVDDPEYPFLFAVQFHPEIYHASPDDDHSRLIFRAFVRACTHE